MTSQKRTFTLHCIWSYFLWSILPYSLMFVFACWFFMAIVTLLILLLYITHCYLSLKTIWNCKSSKQYETDQSAYGLEIICNCKQCHFSNRIIYELISRKSLLIRRPGSYICICWRYMLPYTRFCNCPLDYHYMLHIINFAILYWNQIRKIILQHQLQSKVALALKIQYTQNMLACIESVRGRTRYKQVKEIFFFKVKISTLLAPYICKLYPIYSDSILENIKYIFHSYFIHTTSLPYYSS
jgi:hypothetical protein